MTKQLTLPDDRSLEYLVSGPEDGFALVWIHGTPSCCLQAPCLSSAYEKKGMRVITFSRPGYSGSTRKKGRRVVDTVADVQALLDYLGVKKCCVGGWSGGGADALACAARLQGCVAVLSVAAFAPYEAEGLDWLAGKEEASIKGFEAVLKGEEELLNHINPVRLGMLSVDTATGLDGLAKSFHEVDQEAIRRNRLMGLNLVESMRQGLKENCDGWVDDNLAMMAPWGFTLHEIKVPILLYHGELDNTVPFAHGEWLAKHLPQEKLTKHLLQGQGHISIYIGHEESVLDKLLKTI